MWPEGFQIDGSSCSGPPHQPMFWGPFFFIGSLSLSFVCNLSGSYVTFNHNRQKAHLSLARNNCLALYSHLLINLCIQTVLSLFSCIVTYSWLCVWECLCVCLIVENDVLDGTDPWEWDKWEGTRKKAVVGLCTIVQCGCTIVFMLELHSGRWV